MNKKIIKLSTVFLLICSVFLTIPMPENINAGTYTETYTYRAPGNVDWYDKEENYYLGMMANQSTYYYNGRFDDPSPKWSENFYYGAPQDGKIIDYKILDYGWDEPKPVNADEYASRGKAQRNKLVYSDGSYWFRSEGGVLNKYRKGVWILYEITVEKNDDKPPTHIFDGLYSHIYKNGNDYWTTPNDQVRINLRQRDVDSGNKYQYLRLYGSGTDVRSRHNFNSSSSNHHKVFTDSRVSVNSASRTENTSYGRVNWYVTPKNHGDFFNVHYYYTDNVGNTVGYNDTGMNLRVDGVAPIHKDTYIYSHLYKNGSDYWTKPNNSVYMRFQQQDGHSGNKYQYFRLMRNGSIEVRSRHDFFGSSSSNNKQITSSRVSVDSAYRDQNSSYGRVRWKVTPKQHGDTYTIQRYYQDNVNNSRGYVSDGRLRVDGKKPSISLSPNSKSWTNSNVTVKATASDTDSGVKRIRYRTYQNGSWSNYSSWINNSTTNITLSSEGSNRIHVQAEDNVGNVESHYSSYYYIDKTDPKQSSHGITGYDYKNGNDYWVRPNNDLSIRLRGYDYHSNIYLSYLRLKGSDEARSQHNWNNSSTHLNNYNTSNHIVVNSVKRTYKSSNNRTKEVTFNVRPKTHGQYYNVYSLFRDNASNWSDNYVWNNTGKTIRTDGVAPVTSFSPNSQDWTEGSITVKANISDSDSGVKRFRYRTYNEGTWSSYSSWISSSSKTFTIDQVGENRIHVQSEDNVGNVRNNYSGYYYINNPPVADFDWTPKPAYEGDTLTLNNLSTDPDGHDMTAKWYITNSTGETITRTNWNPTVSDLQEGDYTVRLIVEDEIGSKDEVTKTIKVIPLKITGEVHHTSKWEQIHSELNNPTNVFYSGEQFLLEANVTDYPIQKVRVIFEGKQITGDKLLLEENLLSNHPNYYGMIYDSTMSDPDERLENGNVYFLFEATWSNGVVKRDLVTVKIKDTAYNIYDFYRSN